MHERRKVVWALYKTCIEKPKNSDLNNAQIVSAEKIEVGYGQENYLSLKLWKQT